jgi:hypothetical protein
MVANSSTSRLVSIFGSSVSPRSRRSLTCPRCSVSTERI